MPLALWLMLRAIETQRLFSRLYLAIVLALIYFPTEQITGIGIWLIWLALVIDPARTGRQVAIATVLLGALLGLTHPSIAMMSLLYLAVGVVLTAFGRPVPRRSLVAAAAMSALLIAAYFGPVAGCRRPIRPFSPLSPSTATTISIRDGCWRPWCCSPRCPHSGCFCWPPASSPPACAGALRHSPS